MGGLVSSVVAYMRMVREETLAAASMQAGGRNQFHNIAELATLPVATQFEGAQSFTIVGHPIMTNNWYDS
ncbi:hypothetical protein M378DRAFT_163295 [Amanita muscaria Koide BX008]|uniref:Uncharacterized protein n=1 Tax=Amanita muscaria (strain Koide BX008) TaxID=946122 RepID=A0A0C2X5J1_AMAMK|nr:hypothetical protein M378DRAFT_163295 [Amanita muscaria Koide BX008]